MNNEEIEIYGDIQKTLESEEGGSSPRAYVSPAVIKRLPRYFRYLRELIRNGKMRISSGELSKMMNVTASQIRQDLNCFGGFGQQGYGYNVKYLYAKISDILGVNCNFRAVIVGAGNLGRALVRNPMFTKRGVSTVAMFDIDKDLIGNTVAGVGVYSMEELESFCEENLIDIAVLTLPKECAQQVSDRLVRAGVLGIWNFTGKELEKEREDVKIVNVHLGDSLMTLCYELNHMRTGEEEDK
ncbi:MAG: redox-sensing transcriptional repressor Rex [Ruminococcaceae bacterium]|nr:redox-sensing transcriptional repressor Rex [Oscillospiraceae bacterium]